MLRAKLRRFLKHLIDPNVLLGARHEKVGVYSLRVFCTHGLGDDFAVILDIVVVDFGRHDELDAVLLCILLELLRPVGLEPVERLVVGN